MNEDTNTTPVTKPVSDDFIPVDNSAPIQSIATDQNQHLSMAEKLRIAKLSMEGPERTIKREREEKEKKIAEEKTALKQQLALVVKKKEDLEIGWVVLDNKRLDLKKMLAPVLTEEDSLELKEEELEGKERTTITVTDRQAIEKERFELQDKRHNLEKQKWDYENKILKIEELIKENTDKYQALLDEEEKVSRQIEDLDSELILMDEQIKLEAEERMRKMELAEAESERKRREEIAKKEAATAGQRKKEEDEQKAKAEAEAKLAKEKALAEAKKIDDAKKAETVTQIKSQTTPAGVRVAMGDDHKNVLSEADKAIDEAKKRAAKMAEMKARGDQEMNRLNLSIKPAPAVNQNPVTPTTAPKPAQTATPVNPEPATAQAPVTPSIKDSLLEEEYNLPKVRTLKTDTARMQAGELNRGDKKGMPWFSK